MVNTYGQVRMIMQAPINYVVDHYSVPILMPHEEKFLLHQERVFLLEVYPFTLDKPSYFHLAALQITTFKKQSNTFE